VAHLTVQTKQDQDVTNRDVANQRTSGDEAATTADAMAGDREAMARLWRDNRRWIAAVLLMHKPRQVDLEDLLQDVALTVVNKIQTLKRQENVKAWLRTVAVNAARAAGRSVTTRTRHEHNGAVDNALHAPSADANLVESEYGRQILRLLSELPEDYREPLALRAMQGLSSRQIGDILGLSEATVDTRIARARARLRSRLESQWHDNHDGRETQTQTHALEAQAVSDE